MSESSGGDRMSIADVSAGNPPEIDSILDAAEDRFEQVGARLTTINDIARHAGVGRATVYRRIGGRDEVIQAVTMRAAARLIADIDAIGETAASIEDLVAEAFATTVGRMRAHPVWTRMLEIDPGTALPQITVNGGDVLAAAIGTAAATLDRAVQVGLTEPIDDTVGLAETLVRIVHSVVLTPRALIALDTHDQLVAFAHAHLIPLVQAGRR